jgi:hypothetical protein
MSASIEFLLNRLRDEGEKSVQFFIDLPPEKWGIRVYTDGSQWTVHQVLSHFVMAESSLCRLIENIANDGPGAPEDFDLNGYNEYKVSTVESMSDDELIIMFKNNRQKTIGMVSKFTANDLEKRGRHPFLGIASLLDIIKLIYRHNQIHIREIRQMLDL